MRPFDTGFAEVVAGQTASQTGAAAGDAYVSQVQGAIDSALDLLRGVGDKYGNLGPHYLKGFMAEAFHAGTFNIDAARLGEDGVSAEMLGSTGRGSADVRVTSAEGSHDFQLKYYKTPADTAKAVSNPEYANQGKVVPADQLDGVRESAAAQAERISAHRPGQAGQYLDTATNATGSIKQGDVTSHPLTEAEAMKLAREARDGGGDLEKSGLRSSSIIQGTDLFRETATAAGTAAVISAALHVVPKLYSLVRTRIEEGEFEEGALRELGMAAASGGIHGFLRGGVSASLVVVTRSGMLGPALQSISPVLIGAGTAVAFNVARDAFRLGRGELTADEFVAATGQNVTMGAAGCAGVAVGQALIPIPVLGALIGGFIGSSIGMYGFQSLVSKRSDEAWQAQVGLATSIAQLAESTRVVVEKTRTLVVLTHEESQALATSVAGWQETRRRVARSLSRSSEKFDRVSAGAEELKRRLAAIGRKRQGGDR